ncbi:MAG: nitrate/nitrite transporter NrtS [Cyanobacteria bacterium J06631_6]
MSRLPEILLDPKFAPTAVRVSLVVGSILFTINHGAALAKGEMTKTRWLSGLITYLVPYSVSIHGQYTSRSRSSIEN